MNVQKQSPTRQTLAKIAIRRMLSPVMRQIVRSRGLSDDIAQTISITEWLYADVSDREFMNAVQREVYHTLRSYGFIRPKYAKTYDDPILPFSVAVHSNIIPESERIRLIKEIGEK